jgi:hypothetical protein
MALNDEFCGNEKQALDLIKADNLLLLSKLYIYIDTPSARRPQYIYRLILRETIGLGKNP